MQTIIYLTKIKPAQMIKEYILNFHSNLDGLRDFVSFIEPVLDDYRNKTTQKHKGAFTPFRIARNRHFAKTEEEKQKYQEELNQVFSGEIEIISTENQKEICVDANEGVIRYRLKGDTSKIDEAFNEFAKTVFHEEQLYKNSLISLVSSVEWFFSQILHFYYDKFPEAAGIRNKTLTLEDLKSFGSLKDAESFLIENKIEEILRSSIKDWFKFLKEDLKLGMSYNNNYEEDLIEIYQRRNILIHNGGIVNSIYLSKVSDKFKQKNIINDKIEVDNNYLDESISKLELIFTLIACEFWKKLNADDSDRAFVLMNSGYKFLKKGKWELSECINTFLFNDKKMPIANRTIAQLNVWLCKKELGKFSEIKKELEEIDYSDKSLLFQIALAALKNDKEFFFENLNQVLKTEELSPESLYDFPIMREMRETEEFNQFKEDNEIIKVYLRSLD